MNMMSDCAPDLISISSDSEAEYDSECDFECGSESDFECFFGNPPPLR